ncbi:hypothetical protein D3C87_1396810 [compost metagenome]
MATQEKLKAKDTVSFSVYPTAVLPSSYKNVKVLGIIDDTTARALGLSVEEKHVNVYNSLPIGTPDDPTAYLYVRIQHPSGEFEILGLPWIRESTIVSLNFNTITAKISQVSPDDYEDILAVLASAGYNHVELSTSSN